MVNHRLITRLDRAIGAAADPLQREYLKAERVGALARLGLLSDARFAVSGLRTQNLRHKDALLSAWISLVEGQAEHFDTVAPTAAGKFQRALELAEAAGHEPMQALASAWLANCAFNAGDVPAMIRFSTAALRRSSLDQHATQTRVAVVLANAYRCVNDDEAARAWYLRARAHAIADGDSSMVSVMLHNISAMRASQISLADAFGRADLAQAQRALLEAESVGNYDWGTGVASLSAMVPVIRAQLLVALSRFEEAIGLFDEYLDRARDEGMARRGPRFLTDRAWCHVRLGRIADAQADVRAAEAGVKDQRDADDRAAAYARLACIHRHCGRDADAHRLQCLAEQALTEFAADAAKARRALDQALEGLGS